MLNYNYIEINIVCILILGIIYFRILGNRSTISTAQIIMKKLLISSVVLCVADIIASIFRGQTFNGARILIEVSNIIYFEAMPIIAMYWLIFVCNRVERKLSKARILVFQIPITLFTALAVTNPLTNFLFSIDENNLYVRGPGVFIHWIVSWFYFISAGVVTHRAYSKDNGWNKHNEYRPLLVFLIFPAIGCAAQMLLYGITSVQVGITLSIILINFQLQDNIISNDELTGINNRKEMNNYIDRIIERGKSTALNVFMIDVNKFKTINDTFGHSVGDEALKDVANALKQSCADSNDDLFLCRYGGDEFVIISHSTDENDTQELKSIIHNNVKKIASEKEKPYELSISIGNAFKECYSVKDFEECIKTADEKMYLEKNKI